MNDEEMAAEREVVETLRRSWNKLVDEADKGEEERVKLRDAMRFVEQKDAEKCMTCHCPSFTLSSLILTSGR